MILIREVDGGWVAKVERMEAPLRRGMHVLVDPSAIEMAEPKKVKPKKEVDCRVVEWQYRIKSAEEGQLEVIVDQVVPPLLDRVLKSDQSKVKAGYLLALTVVLPAVAVAVNTYLDRNYPWELAGHLARPVGTWGLLILFGVVIPTRLRLNRNGLTVSGAFYVSLLVLSGLVLMGLWRSLSAFPENFIATRENYATYAHGLAAKLNTSYWPIVVAVLPWVGVVFKALGFEVAEKTADALREAGKKSE